MLNVELPDSSILKVKGTSAYDAAKSIGIGLANDFNSYHSVRFFELWKLF
jgi:hypothetical protein